MQKGFTCGYHLRRLVIVGVDARRQSEEQSAEDVADADTTAQIHRT
jgi:hypothetical protein